MLIYFRNFLGNNKLILLFWTLIFLLSFLGRWFLIDKFPAMYSWDAFTRLWESDSLFVRHWLPVPQLPITLAKSMGLGLTFVRFCYIFIGSVAVVSFGIAISRLYGRRQGIITALLLCALPSFIKFTIVPYQEGMLLAFIGLFLALTPTEDQEVSLKNIWLSILFLVLACLSRYEAWIFVFLLCSKYILNKKWKLLKTLIPVFLVLFLWIALSPHIIFADGPPKDKTAMSSTNFDVLTNFTYVTEMAIDISAIIFKLIKLDLSWVGIILMPFGVFFVLAKKNIAGKEMLLWWVILLGLVFVRGINTSGIVTDRMVSVFNFISMIYVALGLIYLENIFKKISKKVSLVFSMSLIIVLITLGLLKSYVLVYNSAAYFYPEYIASKKLEGLAPDSTVLILHRPLPNILKESSVGAIFANSFGRLKHSDSRFTFWPNQPVKKTNYVLRWTKQGYHLLDISNLPNEENGKVKDI